MNQKQFRELLIKSREGDKDAKSIIVNENTSNTDDGQNLGRIIDIEINSEGQIINLIVEKKKIWRFYGWY